MLCGMCGVAGPPRAGYCMNCGAPARWHQLDGLGQALVVLLALDALAGLSGVFASGMRAAAGLLALPIVVVFLVWFYQARRNAGLLDWRQRLSTGWAIGGWFVPVIFLWFPYMIMADVWRAGLPASERPRFALLPGAWWTCWILAWLTGYTHETIMSSGPGYQSTASMHSFIFDGTWLSALMAAIAAVLLAVIIRRVSNGPVGGALPTREPDPSYPSGASG
jgi:Domain of unknown function (DUF4328)